MVEKVVLMVLLVALLLAMWVPAKAQMPPLYLEMYLPWVAVPLPELPPCECDPDEPVCVC